MKKKTKYNKIMEYVKLHRKASRNVDIEFKIPKVLHTVVKDKKKEQSKNFCKKFKF